MQRNNYIKFLSRPFLFLSPTGATEDVLRYSLFALVFYGYGVLGMVHVTISRWYNT